jgi:hypothetical protein
MSGTAVDYLLESTIKNLYEFKKKTRYISGKPAPGIEPGTGGFNDLSASTFVSECRVSTGYIAPILKFRFDSQHGSCGNQ